MCRRDLLPKIKRACETAETQTCCDGAIGVSTFRDRLGAGRRQMGSVGTGGLRVLLKKNLDKGQKEPVAGEGGEAR